MNNAFLLGPAPRDMTIEIEGNKPWKLDLAGCRIVDLIVHTMIIITNSPMVVPDINLLAESIQVIEYLPEQNYLKIAMP